VRRPTVTPNSGHWHHVRIQGPRCRSRHVLALGRSWSWCLAKGSLGQLGHCGWGCWRRKTRHRCREPSCHDRWRPRHQRVGGELGSGFGVPKIQANDAGGGRSSAPETLASFVHQLAPSPLAAPPPATLATQDVQVCTAARRTPHRCCRRPSCSPSGARCLLSTSVSSSGVDAPQANMDW